MNILLNFNVLRFLKILADVKNLNYLAKVDADSGCKVPATQTSFFERGASINFRRPVNEPLLFKLRSSDGKNGNTSPGVGSHSPMS